MSNVWQRNQWQKWSQQVNPIFHRLIQENRGSITELDLAMKANFSVETAKQYLDSKAAFGAQRQDYEDRGTVYYFMCSLTGKKSWDITQALRGRFLSFLAEARMLISIQVILAYLPRELMNIRCENPSDYQAIAELNIQAFEQENEARLVEHLRHSDRYIPELSLVAELDGAVAGLILFSYIELVGEETLQVIGLAPLAVRPKLQRQGIGSALVRAGLAKADTMGEALVIVLGHPQFYCRFAPSHKSQVTSGMGGLSRPFLQVQDQDMR